MMQDDTADGLQKENRAAPAAMHASSTPSRQGDGIGPQARKRIGTHLRTLYDSVLQQPVPDRFAKLIAELDDSAPPAEPGK